MGFLKIQPSGANSQRPSASELHKFLVSFKMGGKMFLGKTFSSHGSTFGSNISPWWRGHEGKWMGPPLKPMPWAFQISNTHLVTPHQGHVMGVSRSNIFKKIKGAREYLCTGDTRILMQNSVVPNKGGIPYILWSWAGLYRSVKFTLF